MRITDRNDWFELWFADEQCIINTMINNITDDLKAGYNYFGDSIRSQVEQIETYKAKFDRQIDEFKLMDENSVNRWCYYDMKKRGAIS